MRGKLLVVAALVPVVIGAYPASASTPEPSSRYNGPINGSAFDCIAPRDPNAPIEMWAFNGADTGFRFNGLRYTADRPCAPGLLKISQFPAARINGTTMYFQRGGSGTTAQDGEAIRHGHVRVGDLSRRPTQRRPDWPNGRPCERATGTLYYNNPQPMPENFEYKPFQTTSDWENYGDPAQTDGTYHPPGVHYNYILWSWLTDARGNRNPGGGQVRAVVMKNDRIRRCDVASITSPAYAEGTSTVVGYVRGVYGRVRSSSGDSAEGWFVHSWRWANSAQWNTLVSTSPVP